MRVIRRAAAVLLVVDGRDKSPLREASILTDGQRRPFVSKGNGYFVFLDLPPGAHCFEISAPGFQTVRRVIPADAPVEVAVMQYAVGAPRLRGIDHYHFCFSGEGGAPLAQRRVRVTLHTGCSALRVVQSAAKGQYSLALSGEYAPGMLYQPFEAGKAGTLTLVGYDREKRCYLLREPLKEKLSAASALKPFWVLETNRDGAAILPSTGLFMQREELAFSFETEGAKPQTLTLLPPAGGDRVLVTFSQGGAAPLTPATF